MANILTNFAKIPPESLDLFTFRDSIILLMPLALAFGKSNLFQKHLIF